MLKVLFNIFLTQSYHSYLACEDYQKSRCDSKDADSLHHYTKRNDKRRRILCWKGLCIYRGWILRYNVSVSVYRCRIIFMSIFMYFPSGDEYNMSRRSMYVSCASTLILLFIFSHCVLFIDLLLLFSQ